MLIGIDASKAGQKKRTGVENTLFQIILHMQKFITNDEINLYTPNRLDKSLLLNPKFKEKTIPFHRLWHRFRLPLALFRDKPDIFLEITNVLPAFSPKKSIYMIHDLAYKFFPESYSKYELLMNESNMKSSLKRAEYLIFTSNANRDDFYKFYNFPKDKTRIVPLGYDKKIYKVINKPKNILKLKSPYFLFVGRLEKRKNVANIIEAFSLFKQKNNTAHKLVLVGKKGYGYEKIIQKINSFSELKKEIIVPGYLNDKDLAHLYSASDAFIFPSLYEGFGIPVLEAMASGIPVLTSNIPTLKEVAGDGALYVDPKNTNDIADGIENIISNKKKRSDSIKKGVLNIKKYSWENTAKEVFNIIKEMK